MTARMRGKPFPAAAGALRRRPRDLMSRVCPPDSIVPHVGASRLEARFVCMPAALHRGRYRFLKAWVGWCLQPFDPRA